MVECRVRALGEARRRPNLYSAELIKSASGSIGFLSLLVLVLVLVDVLVEVEVEAESEVAETGAKPATRREALALASMDFILGCCCHVLEGLGPALRIWRLDATFVFSLLVWFAAVMIICYVMLID